jgi:predicted kinase
LKILKWFIKTFPNYIHKMRNCSYHYDDENLNLHHLEGDVWSHTLLSYQNCIRYSVNPYVKWAVLLHDIGRVFTREEDSKKKSLSFGDYEGVSCFVALEILNRSELDEHEKSRVLKIISYHYSVIDHILHNDPTLDNLVEKFIYEKELFSDLAEYVRCDIFGKIVDSKISSKYDMQRVDALSEFVKIADNRKKPLSLKPHTLYILVGPPCSRKSSWREKNYNDSIVVSRDYYVEQIGKNYNKLTYDDAFELYKSNKKAKKEVLALEKLKEDEAKNSKGCDIIIDNPNHSIKNRSEWIKALKNSHKIRVILFLTPFNMLMECLDQRSKEINKSLDEEGLINKLKAFEFPLLNEGIDEIEVIYN